MTTITVHAEEATDTICHEQVVNLSRLLSKLTVKQDTERKNTQADYTKQRVKHHGVKFTHTVNLSFADTLNWNSINCPDYKRCPYFRGRFVHIRFCMYSWDHKQLLCVLIK